jgi:hypothetical protein
MCLVLFSILVVSWGERQVNIQLQYGVIEATMDHRQGATGSKS